MRRYTSLIVVAGVLLAADKPREAAVKKELKNLQGTWVAVSIEENGRRLRPRLVRLANVKLTIAGDRFTFHSPRGNAEGTVAVDPTRKPKTIDYVATEKEKNRLGIYQLDGDTLKVCSGKEKRPT
jgi:uncharacterized protein (TIGR03067 family)